MKLTRTALPGVLLIEPRCRNDARGFFIEMFKVGPYEEAGVSERFVQDNLSHSKKHVLRRLHFQRHLPRQE